MYKVKEKMQTDTLIVLVNQLLASAIDCKLSAKQAHWNVRGENFIALHELFDKASREIDEYADLLAERVAQLGGGAQGTLSAVAGQTSLSPYPAGIQSGRDHAKALSDAIGALANSNRQAIETVTGAGDMVTADILTEITRGLDKLHWFVSAHVTGQ